MAAAHKSYAVFRIYDIVESVDKLNEFEKEKLSEKISDENGKLLKEISFYDNGDEAETFEYTYESDHRYSVLHVMDNEPAETIDFVKDDKGNIISETKKFSEGGFTIKEYEYDAHNNVVAITDKNEDGEIEARESFRYLNKLLTEHAVYDSNDKLLSIHTIVYFDNSDKEKEEIFDNKEEGVIKKILYNEDHSQVTVYTGDNKMHSVQKSISDEKGRVVESKIEDKSGSRYYTYSYDEFDNVLKLEYFLNGTLIHKTANVFDDKNRIVLSCVTDAQNGFYTDWHCYPD